MSQSLIKFIISFVFITITSFSIKAQQNNFLFAQLGSSYYADKISQLEKYKAPKFYTDKSAQAWYDEILTGRNKAILDAFKDNDIIYDTLLLNKCNAIFSRLAKANTNFKFDTIKLYINRSMMANAACYGEGTIMINLGLFLWVDNDDELALVLAHEIAHQLLDHGDQKIKKTISSFTSEDFKQELKDIKKSTDGKYARLKKLMKDLTIESGKHSTYKESEADSLGVILAKNANYNITDAAKIILKLDNVDDLFKSDKLYTLKDFFEKAPINFSFLRPKPKYNGLSNVSVTMNADKDFDSIKTHPDCKKRYEAIMGQNATATITCCTALNDLYKPYKEKAMLEIVRHLYENGALGYCVHSAIFALKNNYSPNFYNYFLSMCFSKIYYNDKNLKRFNSVNAGADKGSNLKELQDFLFEVTNADLEILALHYLNNTSETSSEDYEFASLMFQTQIKLKETEGAYNIFNSTFKNSKYTYLITPKKAK